MVKGIPRAWPSPVNDPLCTGGECARRAARKGQASLGIDDLAQLGSSFPKKGERRSLIVTDVPATFHVSCLVISGVPQLRYAVASAPWREVTRLRIASSTTSGWESIGQWLLSTSYVVAPMRSAENRCRSGWTLWSWVATM